MLLIYLNHRSIIDIAIFDYYKKKMCLKRKKKLCKKLNEKCLLKKMKCLLSM